MSVLRVLRLGTPVLRRVAEPANREQFVDGSVAALVADMVDTMRDYGGVGIAAPQVGVPLRVLAMEVRDADRYREAEPFGLTLIVNPALKILPGAPQAGWEGCLSIEGLRGLVPRNRHVVLKGLDVTGNTFQVELTGFPAVIAHHEVDHLDGNVYLDRMPDLRSLTYLEEFERYHRRQAAVEDNFEETS